MSTYFSAQTDPHLFRCPCNRPECDAPLPMPELLDVLDLLRGAVNRPLIITSGVRCEQRNTSIGGELDSEHLTGRAADIWAPSSNEMYTLVEAGYSVGLARLGVYRDKHLHIDVSLTKPQRVLWIV